MLQRIHDSLGKWVVGDRPRSHRRSASFSGASISASRASRRLLRGSTARTCRSPISIASYKRAQNQYQQIYRTELPEDVRRELRRTVVEDLVREHGAQAARRRARLSRVRRARDAVDSRDRGVPGRRRVFAPGVPRDCSPTQGLSPTAFEALQRESLEVGDLHGGIADSTFLTPAEFRRYIELYNQRREVAYALFDIAAFSADVTIDDAAIAARYENNQASYQTAETVDLEYIELALADIAATVELTEEELRAAYEEERERFQTAEERRASHILIEVADGEEDAARATAESVAARVQRRRGLCRRRGRGFRRCRHQGAGRRSRLDRPRDVGRVRSRMRCSRCRSARSVRPCEPSSAFTSFASTRCVPARCNRSKPCARSSLPRRVRGKQRTSSTIARISWEKPRSMRTTSSRRSRLRSNLPIKTLKGFPRSGEPAAFTNSAAVVQAAFAEEIVDNGRNSELVELAEDHVLVLRVVAHHVPTTKPLDEVREQIREELTREARAAALGGSRGGVLDGPRARRRSCRARGSAAGAPVMPAAWVDANGRRRADGSLVGGVRHAEDGGRRSAARNHRAGKRRPGRASSSQASRPVSRRR